MDMPKFSIIVPIYKVEKYLNQCVESVLTQSYEDFELILVDDGSPDNCGKMCDAFVKKDKRVKVVHKENGGLVSARKAGAEVATGDYVVCLDGDDWLDARCLETYSEIIETYNVDLIVSRGGYASEDGTVYAQKNNWSYRKGLYSRINIEKEIFPMLMQNENAEYFVPSAVDKAFRTDLYKKIQLSVSDKIKIGEDGACTIPYIWNAKSLFITDAISFYYRQTTTSMTREKKAFDWNGPELIYKHIRNQITISDFDFEEQLYRKTVHELFNVAVSQFYRKEKYKALVRDIKKNLQNPIYSECIKKARFKSLKGRFATDALRHGRYGLIKLYSLIHSF